MNNDMFQQAAKKKLRFTTAKGQVSAETLYELSLDDLAKLGDASEKKLRETSQGGFFSSSQKRDKDEELRYEILKYVYTDKQADSDRRARRVEKNGQLAHLKGLLLQKQTEKLSAGSEEDIARMIANLENED